MLLDWLKENRLKAVSASALLANVFMGLAGGMGLLNFSLENSAYALMSLGGAAGVTGHFLVLVWGKGAASEQHETTHATSHKAPSIFVKPFMPWRYPLDSALFCLMTGNLLFVWAGLLLGNFGLVGNGAFSATASIIGWLWPQDKPLGNFNSIQVTSILFLLATFSNFVAGFWAMDIMIILASTCFLAANMILYTVRKDSQSSYTQTHE